MKRHPLVDTASGRCIAWLGVPSGRLWFRGTRAPCIAGVVLSLVLAIGTSLVLLPAVATSMQVAAARSAAGICSAHSAVLAPDDGGRSQPSPALDCAVCAFAAAGAAAGTKRLAPDMGVIRVARPAAAMRLAARVPAYLHPPGQAPPPHA